MRTAGVKQCTLDIAAWMPSTRSRVRAVRGSASVGNCESCHGAQIDQSAREYHDICAAIDAIGHLGARGQDALVARGERVAAQLLTAAVAQLKRRVRYVDAIEVVETDGEHGSATPKLDDTRARARKVIRYRL